MPETTPSANPTSSEAPATALPLSDQILGGSPATEPTSAVPEPASAVPVPLNQPPPPLPEGPLSIQAPTSLLAELRELTASEFLPTGAAPAHSDTSADRKRKAVPGAFPKPQYFEFAKRRWEKDEAFLLPDGTFWPIVQEGNACGDHGAVTCALCLHHSKDNNFTGEGYRKGKRSALVDHAIKNRHHKFLVAEMQQVVSKVTCVSGVAQRLIGKVAIITGAAKGIGYACAQCLGKEGAAVIVADIDDEGARRAAQQLQDQQIAASAFKCDVGNKSEVEQLVAATVATFGGVDILISNAGIVRVADFLDMSEEDFDDVIRVNLKGCFLVGQAVGRQMQKQNLETPGRSGVIINMTSVNGLTAIPNIAGYNASKGGVTNLTRAMALAMAPHNVRVNAIGPGSIMTDVLAAVATNKSSMNKILSRTPMGRIGDPTEIGQVAAFLASDAASYMTGETIYVDGGRMALNYTVPVPEQ